MRIGIDLGGSKIEAAVLDATGQFRIRQRVATPQGDYPATLHAIGQLITEAEATLKEACDHVGIGHPGSSCPQDGRIRNANSTCLNGQTLQADLEVLLRRPVRLANDADCLALSEAVDGAARGCSSVFAVILGTGVGGGLFMNGRLHQGPNGLAGEWGHNPLPISTAAEFPGPRCYCGKHGCIEAWLSGPALVADYQRQHSDALTGDVPTLIAAAAAGNVAACDALNRHTQRLARSLAVIINAFDPEAIVLGGGVSQRPDLIAGLNDALGAYVFLPAGTTLRTKIFRST